MRYPGATWKPLPQNVTSSSISPTQVILHSATSPNIDQVWKFFAAGSGGAHTESHFIVGYDGSVIQCMDTLRRADAQWDGNAHGISIETASNGAASDAWTPAQATALIALGKWLNVVHTAIPLRQCRTATDPGYGYHRLFQQWNQSNHSCPGNLRVKQFPLILQQIITPAPKPPEPPIPAPLEADVFLFKHTLTGAPEAWFVTDAISQYRWLLGPDLTALAAAGVKTITTPTYLSTMTLVGPIPHL